MLMPWSILLKRENVDITSISGIDPVFLRHMSKYYPKEENFFSVSNKRELTHYTSIDIKELGWKLFEEYFNSPELIKKHYCPPALPF